MKGLQWLRTNNQQAAELIEGMADAIEKRFVINPTRPGLSGKQVAKIIVETMRETAEDLAK